MHDPSWRERLLNILHPSKYPHLDSFIEARIPHALGLVSDKIPIPAISKAIFIFFGNSWCCTAYVAGLVLFSVLLHLLSGRKASFLLSRWLSAIFFIFLIGKIIIHANTCQHVAEAMGKLVMRPGIEGFVGIQYLYSPLVLACELITLHAILHTLFFRQLMKASAHNKALSYVFWLLFVANLVIYSMCNDVLPPLTTVDGLQSAVAVIVGYVTVLYGIPFCMYGLCEIVMVVRERLFR